MSWADGPAVAPGCISARNWVNREPIRGAMRMTPSVFSQPGSGERTKLSGVMKAWLRPTWLRPGPKRFIDCPRKASLIGAVQLVAQERHHDLQGGPYVLATDALVGVVADAAGAADE